EQEGESVRVFSKLGAGLMTIEGRACDERGVFLANTRLKADLLVRQGELEQIEEANALEMVRGMPKVRELGSLLTDDTGLFHVDLDSNSYRLAILWLSIRKGEGDSESISKPILLRANTIESVGGESQVGSVALSEPDTLVEGRVIEAGGQPIVGAAVS